MEFIVSNILAVILTGLSICVSIRYSSKYRVKKIKHYRERYVVTEKIAQGTKNGFVDSARIVLDKSSINNAMGFMDVLLTSGKDDVYVDRYAFVHACIHAVFAPGKTILKNSLDWVENSPSNDFDNYTISSVKVTDMQLGLIPKCVRNIKNECCVVESDFSFPETYTGPRYKKRTIVIVKGVGIVACKTVYVNGDIDSYSLRKYKVTGNDNGWLPLSLGTYWVYDIHGEFGPNMLNICT